jgi:hypothetical protein
MMMTINALSLMSMTEFMDQMLMLRRKYWHKMRNQTAVMSFNILRFPSFMSIVTLPAEVRTHYADKLEAWLNTRLAEENSVLHEHERQGIERTIAYIREVEVGHYATSSLESRQRDFKTFYQQYDQRRGKNFAETFPELSTWYQSIPDTDLKELQTLVDGDSTKGWRHVDELLVKANREGWVMKHSGENPGSKDYNRPKETKSLWDLE